MNRANKIFHQNPSKKKCLVFINILLKCDASPLWLERVCKSNMTDATCGAENAYPSGTPEFTPGF